MRKAGVSPGVFEITDYTNSTEFEEFIYSVEQVIEKWGLSKGGFWNNESLPEFSRTESLTYGRQSFRLTHSTLNVGKDFKSLQQVSWYLCLIFLGFLCRARAYVTCEPSLGEGTLVW